MLEEYDDDYKSRSQKKRDSTAAQELGATLAALPLAELRKLDVPEDLAAAIADWKKFPGHEAKRRQAQYIGKLMREMNTEDLREKLEALLAPSRTDTAALHATENLREELLAASPEELETKLAALTAQHPGRVISQLRHLVTAARDERAAKRPPKAYRELFKRLRDI